MKIKKFIYFWLISILVFLLPLTSQSKTLNELKQKYEQVVTAVAQKHGVDPELVHSVIAAESNYDCFAISSKGAMGLMQLMPETAKDYGVEDVFDPQDNIEGGVRYLKELLKFYDQKTDYVLAAYNAGQEAVKKYGKIPPYPETKAYIRRVMAFYKNSRMNSRSKIYTFYDKSGKLVVTNDFLFYSSNKVN